MPGEGGGAPWQVGLRVGRGLEEKAQWEHLDS